MLLSKVQVSRARHSSLLASAGFVGLADRFVFVGLSIGFTGQTSGEVVFNTSMTGYQEIPDRLQLLPANRHADPIRISAHWCERRRR
ncbi:MAG: hypothetical protein IPJ18_03090 [Betaproteobacteria bacterium]|nr:hypothetical protein [Betaproteobacteria bacterium]